MRAVTFAVFAGHKIASYCFYCALMMYRNAQYDRRKRKMRFVSTPQNVIYCSQRKLRMRYCCYEIPANGFTHAGKFHADDVFATALQIIRPDIRITRGFVVPDDFDGIVYDIGFGMFDHHQEPRQTRANGVPLCGLRPAVAGAGPGWWGSVEPGSSMKTSSSPGPERQHRQAEQPVRCHRLLQPVWDSRRIRTPASSRPWLWQSRSWKTGSTAPMP